MKRLAACILVALLVLTALCPAVMAETQPVITVKVGYFAFPGCHVKQDDGSVPRGSGYGNDFLQLLRRYANINFEYVGYLDSGTYDRIYFFN